MYTEEEKNLIILSSFEQLSYSVKRLLLADLTCAAPDFEANEKFLIKTLSGGVYNKVKSRFFDRLYREGIISGLDGKGVKCVTYFSENYPQSLRHTDSPPLVLYCKGDVSLLKTECFAVVGSRKSSPKALADCEEIAGGLTRAFTLVTGLAEGADSRAINGALSAGGKVISVLANGFDNIYPAVNAILVKKIAEEGLVISEYRPEVRARSFYFPMRNRIIAGLSCGVLVVSAGEKSGALITAGYALEYGRDVFAFPYYPGAPGGAGCNLLIKKGAFLVENILDIFVFYGLDFNTPEQEPLSAEEQTVYDAVKSMDGALIAEIASKLGKTAFEILPAVTMLEMKKRLVRLGGNRYSVR